MRFLLAILGVAQLRLARFDMERAAMLTEDAERAARRAGERISLAEDLRRRSLVLRG